MSRFLGCSWWLMAASLLAAQDTTVYVNNDLDLIVKTQTIKLSRFEKALPFLGIKPRMTILDIGAGSGQQTYRMAEELKGTGTVFATEIDPKLVEHIAREAKTRGLNNVHPALVRRDGVDEFYFEHRYDVILLCQTYLYIRDKVDYFRKLRGLLSESGRLVIIDLKSLFTSFAPEDFADWDGFVRELSQEPPESPFHQWVWKPAQEISTQPANGNLKGAVLYYLNDLLDQKELLLYYSKRLDFKSEVTFTPDERVNALWRLHRIALAGFPKLNAIEFKNSDFRALQRLNKLLVLQRFRPYFIWDGPHPYETRAPEGVWSRHLKGIPAVLKNAGYHLEREQDLVPFEGVWIFSDAKKNRLE